MSSAVAPKLGMHRNRSGFTAAATGIALGYGVILAILLMQQKWILTVGGVPMPSDFLAYWAAGVAVLRGDMASVYDPHAFHLLQISLATAFPDFYYWNYPPLLVCCFAAGVAALRSRISPLDRGDRRRLCDHAGSHRRQTGSRCLCACFARLSPDDVCWTEWISQCCSDGRISFVSSRTSDHGRNSACINDIQAATRDIVSPGADGRWALARALLGGRGHRNRVHRLRRSVRGRQLHAVFRSLTIASRDSLTFGGAGWAKIESMYSVARYLGANDHVAWIVQFLTSAISALAVLWLWRSDNAYELKAAGLIAAALISIPYLHEYDFPVILVVFAFLYRQHAFDRTEWLAVAAANLLMAVFLFQLAPIGPAIVMIAGALVIRRAASSYARNSASRK